MYATMYATNVYTYDIFVPTRLSLPPPSFFFPSPRPSPLPSAGLFPSHFCILFSRLTFRPEHMHRIKPGILQNVLQICQPPVPPVVPVERSVCGAERSVCGAERSKGRWAEGSEQRDRVDAVASGGFGIEWTKGWMDGWRPNGRRCQRGFGIEWG